LSVHHRHLQTEQEISVRGWDLAERLERLTANAEVVTVLGTIPASSDTVESEGRQMKQCWISHFPCESGYWDGILEQYS
jgi:hypothetical protein